MILTQNAKVHTLDAVAALFDGGPGVTTGFSDDELFRLMHLLQRLVDNLEDTDSGAS